MKTKGSLPKVVIGIMIGLVCLCVAIVAVNDPLLRQLVKPEKSECTLPPEGFSKKDLIGTWVHPGIEESDMLTIRADGKYKQKLHIHFAAKPDVRYEGEWQSWRLEYVDGIPYLHLDDMRLCAINSDLSCDQPGGKAGFYDFCRDEGVEMDNEGILLVLGVPKELQSPNDHRSSTQWVILWVPMGAENSWTYILQRP